MFERAAFSLVLAGFAAFGVASAACNTPRPAPYQSHFPGFFGPGMGPKSVSSGEAPVPTAAESGTSEPPMPNISGALDSKPLPKLGGNAGPQSGAASSAPGATNGNPSLASAAPNGAAGAGSIAPELVGKWCYMANVYANDGGRQSNTCFVLNGDGTYAYHSETSSSGQYGSTASQADDQGHWVASGNTLTATSVSGKVSSYTFEKQNHPKTHDPMLVVNGQAFVTYFQKPPW